MERVRDYAIQCIKDEANATLALIEQLDDNFDKAVELMYHCKGKVIVTGVGKSGNIGAKIAATLSSTGTPAFFANPLDVFHGDLGAMTNEHSHHWYERQPKIAVGKILYDTYEGMG